MPGCVAEDPVDIGIEQGRIAAVAPNLAVSAAQTIDAAGDLVVPGFVNLHLHADKALLGEVMRPNVSGTLPEAIEITNDFKRKYDPQEVGAACGPRDRDRSQEWHDVLPAVRRRRNDRRIARRPGTAARAREIQGLLRDRGRRLPAGRDRARSRRRRAARRGDEAGLRRGRRPALVRAHRRGSPAAHRHLLRSRQAARPRHPHAGRRHRRPELPQPRVSRPEDDARRITTAGSPPATAARWRPTTTSMPRR